MLLITVVLFFSSSSMQICSSTAVADILPLTRLHGGALRFDIHDERLRHILTMHVGPFGFYKFPIPFGVVRVSMI